MDINSVFKKYDPRSEAEWRDFKEMKFLIAPVGNPTYKSTVLKNLTLKQATAIEQHGPEALDMPGEEAIRLIYTLYADSLVLDWEDVNDGEKKLAFSKKKILEWMMDNDEFANFVVSSANDIRSKQLVEAAEVEKN